MTQVVCKSCDAKVFSGEVEACPTCFLPTCSGCAEKHSLTHQKVKKEEKKEKKTPEIFGEND